MTFEKALRTWVYLMISFNKMKRNIRNIDS